jgi:hypothetical protein|tara:strand:- start:2525 stop:2974 length:450 start_codon:yes stop_codon:yes gene_type:complete
MTINENIDRLTLHTVLTRVAEAKTAKDKKAVLLKHNSLALRNLLRGAFDDSVEWNIPEGTPPYRQADEIHCQHIRKHTKKLRYMVKGGEGDGMSPAKREKMFINFIEIIHPDDAKLTILMKDKALDGKFKGLTKKLVTETFADVNLIRK